jgi:molybdate/tungstate transport system substrate-binding protein
MVSLGRLALLSATLLTALLALSVVLGGVLTGGGGAVVVYAAPTLLQLANEAAGRSEEIRADIRVLGSVAALRLIQQGRVPDVYLTVDAELLREIDGQQRRSMVLGYFRLHLVCREPLGLRGLGEARIGLADPNTAPIGYRSLAALYWLSTRYNLTSLDEVTRSLSVSFTEEGGGSVVIDARQCRAAGRFSARDDLAGVASLFEAGAVDCIFAHTPFIVYKRYGERYSVIDLPEEIQFARDPATRFFAITHSGVFEVKRFVGAAVSFSPAGDRFLEALEALDPESFGLARE